MLKATVNVMLVTSAATLYAALLYIDRKVGEDGVVPCVITYLTAMSVFSLGVLIALVAIVNFGE